MTSPEESGMGNRCSQFDSEAFWRYSIAILQYFGDLHCCCFMYCASNFALVETRELALGGIPGLPPPPCMNSCPHPNPLWLWMESWTSWVAKEVGMHLEKVKLLVREIGVGTLQRTSTCSLPLYVIVNKLNTLAFTEASTWTSWCMEKETECTELLSLIHSFSHCIPHCTWWL